MPSRIRSSHQGCRRQRCPQGRGHPPRHHPGEDGPAQARVLRGRRDPRRQLLADLRRLGRAAVHVGREAKSLGLKPIARVHTATLAGSDPVMMLSGPIPATQKALAKSGLSVDDIGAFEVNEAFAPVPMAWLKEIGADEKKLNPTAARSPGPPARRLRCPSDDHAALPHARQRNSLRSADHVRRRRPGQRHHPRAAVVTDVQAPPAALGERRATSCSSPSTGRRRATRSTARSAPPSAICSSRPRTTPTSGRW